MRQHHRLFHWPIRALLLTVACGLSACQLQEVREAEQADPPSTDQIAELEETIDRQKTTIMGLELRLLAKQSEVQNLSASQEQAIQEVVRVKAKLRSRDSKAETVANLAEAKLALSALQAKKTGGIKATALERADQYLAMSEAALKNGNYDGASYLIGQAKSSLHAAHMSPDEPSESADSSTTFSLPVPMTVRQRCNVRAGPGLNEKVLYQLTAGKAVLATGYQGLWVQISDDNTSAGWIHFSLLKSNP